MKKVELVELFAGVGGLTLGALQAGFEPRLAIELDPKSAAAHSANLPNSPILTADVRAVSAKSLVEAVSPNATWGLVGGPPCQGFSAIGKRDALDPRNTLLLHFFEQIAAAEPDFFVMENVEGILAPRNRPLWQRCLEQVGKYVLSGPLILRASDYGAPTVRTRAVLIGFRSATRVAVSLKPSQAPQVRAALSGLGSPVLPATEWCKLREPRNLSEALTSVPPRAGSTIALQRLRAGMVSGHIRTEHSKKQINRYRKLGPGETDPITKSTRLDPNGYAPTLRAGTSAERGSFQAVRPVHYNGSRVITPREGARIQGFPDWYQFHPTKWHSFRMIGNSVSPMLSKAIFDAISIALTGRTNEIAA